MLMKSKCEPQVLLQSIMWLIDTFIGEGGKTIEPKKQGSKK